MVLCATSVEFGINVRSSTMKGFGVFILIAGICWMIFALNMDVSVTTGISKVYNLGLMADRQVHAIVGCMIALAGPAYVALRRKSQSYKHSSIC